MERLKKLLPVLPALLALLFWPVMGAIAWWSINSVERRYVNYADIALSSGHFNAARIASERLLQLDSPQHPVHVYRMAQALSGLGQKEASMQLLTAVTLMESSALGPAHQFMAEAILRDPDASPETLKMAEYHLKQAQAVGVNPPVILERLGQYYSRIGDWAQAKKSFLQGYAMRKDMALPLAAVSKAQGDALETKRWAREAAEFFQERTEKSKRNSVARADWAQALILLQDYPNAVKVLNTGIKEGDVPAYHRLAAEAIAAWVATLNGKTADSLPVRLNLIEQGLAHDPKNYALLRDLIEVTHLSGAEGDKARTVLNSMLARGESATTAHFCLGMDAWKNGKLDQAREHFEVVFKLVPQMPVIANNLAWLITFTKPTDYERALQIMEEVVKNNPNAPDFRETRGQILVKLGRWKEGVVDLEFAMLSHRDSATTHSALAEAYGKLGMAQLSAEHQRIAQKLKPADSHKPEATGGTK